MLTEEERQELEKIKGEMTSPKEAREVLEEMVNSDVVALLGALELLPAIFRHVELSTEAWADLLQNHVQPQLQPLIEVMDDFTERRLNFHANQVNRLRNPPFGLSESAAVALVTKTMDRGIAQTAIHSANIRVNK